jgi:hypothetical protein
MRHKRQFDFNAIVISIYVARATSPDIACLNARCFRPSRRTRRTTNKDGGQAAMMMD